MKSRQGSALVLVLCVLGALSMLMLRVYSRSSFLLQTVVEREQDVCMQYAADALMLYACHMAKHNWDYLAKHTAQGRLSEHFFEWDINTGKKASATCIYKQIEKGRLIVVVSLQREGKRGYPVTCELLLQDKGKVLIHAWKQKA